MSEEADRMVEREMTRGEHYRCKQKAKAERRKGRDIIIQQQANEITELKLV